MAREESMLHHVKDLSPEQKLTVEVCLGIPDPKTSP
jgi:hypothetical protein